MIICPGIFNPFTLQKLAPFLRVRNLWQEKRFLTPFPSQEIALVVEEAVVPRLLGSPICHAVFVLEVDYLGHPHMRAQRRCESTVERKVMPTIHIADIGSLIKNHASSLPSTW